MICKRCGETVAEGTHYCQCCGNDMFDQTVAAPGLNDEKTVAAPDSCRTEYDATAAATPPAKQADCDEPTVISPAVEQVGCDERTVVAYEQKPAYVPPAESKMPKKQNKGVVIGFAVLSLIAVAAIVVAVLFATDKIGNNNESATERSASQAVVETEKTKDTNGFHSNEKNEETDRTTEKNNGLLNKKPDDITEKVTNKDNLFSDEKPAVTETLKIATTSDFSPYVYTENNELTGIEVEVVKLVAEKLGMRCEIVEVPFNQLVMNVADGTSDIAFSGLTVLPDRLEMVDFSDAYLTNSMSVVVKKGSGIENISDLADKKIGVVADTVTDFYITEDFGEDSVVRFVSGDSAYVSLKSGAIDAVIIDSAPASRFAEASDDIEVLDTPYGEESYAIAVSKDNPELRENINKAIAELNREGKIDEIIAKHTR